MGGDEPVACSLNAAAKGDRVEEWHRLVGQAEVREPIDGGLRLTFPADPALAREAARLSMAEQECCAFYEFELRATPTAVLLSVRAPLAAAALLDELFG